MVQHSYKLPNLPYNVPSRAPRTYLINGQLAKLPGVKPNDRFAALTKNTWRVPFGHGS